MQKNDLKHIAIVLDGNRRYAKSKLLQPWKGHSFGAQTVEKLFEWIVELKIKELTLYTLSTENLKRTQTELNKLFSLLERELDKLIKDKRLYNNQIKIKFIGNLDLIPENLKKICLELEDKTKAHSNHIINIALAYSGRLEIIQAINKLIENKKPITQENFQEELYLQSEPQLIIRTGNQIRTSNFLPWQSTYSEWIFLKKMWPEFTKQDLIDCINEFKTRQRNFGR